MLEVPVRRIVLALAALALIGCSRERPGEVSTPVAPTALAVAPTPAVPPLAITEMPAPEGSGRAAVLDRARASIAAGRRPVVQLWATWCRACKATNRRLDQDSVRAALAGIEILRIDIDAWESAIDDPALEARVVPTFVQLSATGEPTGETISSAAWSSTGRPMTDVLRAFATGT